MLSFNLALITNSSLLQFSKTLRANELSALSNLLNDSFYLLLAFGKFNMEEDLNRKC